MKFLKVSNRQTVYNWFNGRHIPLRPVLVEIAAKINDTFNWGVSSDDLLNKRLSDHYKVKEHKQSVRKIDSEFFIKTDEEIINIGKRLRELRKKRGLTLNQVTEKIKELFPENKDSKNNQYHVSHTHLREMEVGRHSNLYIKKLIALTTVYNESLKYILFGIPRIKDVTFDRDEGVLMVPINPEAIKKMKDDELKEFAQELFKVVKNLYPKIFK